MNEGQRSAGAPDVIDVSTVAVGKPGGTRYGVLLPVIANGIAGGSFACYLFSGSFVAGAVSMFLWPQEDFQQYLTGAKFFIYDTWHFPLFVSSFLERSLPQSMAFTDCIPLFALVAKVVYQLTGNEIPYLAWWYVLVVVAQPISFCLLLWFGGVRNKLLLIAGGLFSMLVPTFLYRGAHHAGLFGHFTFIAAMALYFASSTEAPAGARALWPRWILAAWPLLLLFCSTITLYLLGMAGVFFLVTLAQAALRDLACGQTRLIAIRAFYGAGVIGAVAALMYVVGFFVPSYSLEDAGTLEITGMNLVSPFVPQLSALFANGETIVDATGAQYEGYNYLGAGFLALIFLAALCADRRALRLPARHPVLMLTLAVMILFALSTRVYAGHTLLLSYSLPDFVSIFRSCGRFIWPATYFALFFSIYALETWRSMWRPTAAIAACLLLQWQDTRLLSNDLWSLGHVMKMPALDHDPASLQKLIAQHRGVYMAPDFGCNHIRINDTNMDIGWYAAVEHRPVNTIYFSRAPRDQNCTIDRPTLDAKLEHGYLVAVLYDTEESTLSKDFTCVAHDGGEVCLASRRVPITSALARELFAP